jgi:hypothetical protein
LCIGDSDERGRFPIAVGQHEGIRHERHQ